MYYFAYGSNCSPPRIKQRCPSVSLVGAATLRGWEFGWTKKRSGAVRATIRRNKRDVVRGVLWEGADMDILDSVEGEGFAYERIEVTVRLNGAPVKAYTYVAIETCPPATSVADDYSLVVSLGRSVHGLDTEGAHAVFVYGSLKSGFHNHIIMSSGRMCKFVKNCQVSGFQMADLGAFPAAIPGGAEDVISGELYVVDEATFEHLDRLEGTPHFYRRQWVETSIGFSAWVYVLNKPISPKTRIIKSGVWGEGCEYLCS